jgi:hypothetical protein
MYVIGELKGMWVKVAETAMAYFKILCHHTLSEIENYEIVPIILSTRNVSSVLQKS